MQGAVGILRMNLKARYRRFVAPCSTLGLPAKQDIATARDAIWRCVNSTWWDWTSGSRPLFWRWDPLYRAAIRGGIQLWLKGPVTHWRVPQRLVKDPALADAMRKKIQPIREKGYTTKGAVEPLTSFFAVPKVDINVRMVYNGTKSGLIHFGLLGLPYQP
jgi:hypothetical protein